MTILQNVLVRFNGGYIPEEGIAGRVYRLESDMDSFPGKVKEAITVSVGAIGAGIGIMAAGALLQVDPVYLEGLRQIVTEYASNPTQSYANYAWEKLYFLTPPESLQDTHALLTNLAETSYRASMDGFRAGLPPAADSLNYITGLYANLSNYVTALQNQLNLSELLFKAGQIAAVVSLFGSVVLTKWASHLSKSKHSKKKRTIDNDLMEAPDTSRLDDDDDGTRLLDLLTPDMQKIE